MNDRKFEQMLERLLKQDFSAGTEAFRDDLLSRCLAELNAGSGEEKVDSGIFEIPDGELDLLAAAGDIFADRREGLRQ